MSMRRRHPQIETEDYIILNTHGQERDDAEARLRYLRGHPDITVRSVSTAMAREWGAKAEQGGESGPANA
jgi:hypothetical protein